MDYKQQLHSCLYLQRHYYSSCS